MIDTKALRNKILDLAISGKLTEQLPEDGNAEDLYAQIQEEKARLIAEGKIKKEKPLPPITEEDIPFEIPDNWMWVRLAEIGASIDNAFADGPFGSNLKREHYTEEKQVRIIQLSNVGERGWKGENEKYTTFEHLKTIQRSEVKCGNIVIAKMMPAGRAIIVPDVSPAYVLSSDCVKVVPNPILNNKYICYAINSSGFHYQVIKDVHGIGRERTSLSHLKEYLIPLPPLAEQERIVSAVEYAFDVIDRIEKAQESYYADQEVLKNKIIDAGIRGKLTEQLPEDGNAGDLLNIYAAKKTEIENTGVLKGRKKKKVMTLEGVEYPFEIPSTWKWTRLDSVTEIFGRIGFRGYTKGDIAEPGKGAISLSPSNITKHGDIIFDKCTYISWEKYYESPEIMVNEDDIIIVKTGSSYGKCTIAQNLPEKSTINPQLAVLKYILCDRRYLHIVLNSTLAHKQYNDFVVGAATPTFSQEDLANFLLPLPPIEEQKRIVEIVSRITKNYQS